MRTKKFVSVIISIIILLDMIVLPTFANEIMPRWDNIFSVFLTHGLDNGTACCHVEINGYTGTDRIDNVDIKLYRKIGNTLILVAHWDDLYETGSSFNFYGEVDNVVGGYTYRLAVTADVHRYGYVEQLDTYGDIAY